MARVPFYTPNCISGSDADQFFQGLATFEDITQADSDALLR